MLAEHTIDNNIISIKVTTGNAPNNLKIISNIVEDAYAISGENSVCALKWPSLKAKIRKTRKLKFDRTDSWRFSKNKAILFAFEKIKI